MIHSGAAQLEVKDGFVTIETAERIRQSAVKEQFCKKNAAAFERAVLSAGVLKNALQDWQQNKVAIATLADGVHTSDVLDCVERESKERVAAQLTLAQAEQSAKKQVKRAQ